jgi:transmembrane sensor
MKQEEVQKLVEKYLHGTASEEETNMLFNWYRTELNIEKTLVLDEYENEEDFKKNIFSGIDISDPKNKRRLSSNLSNSFAIAACVLVFMLTGLYFYYSLNTSVTEKIAVEKKSNDIKPGGIKAILTLADGKQILLDDSKNGVVIDQGAIKIHKNSQGIIEYSLTEHSVQAQTDSKEPLMVYNTIQTPAGGKFQLNLADGSKVWLNSESTLRFPVFFSGDSREVELEGEAYFEVSKDQLKKFSVRSGNQTVEVLGTHFNINAYANEPSITTTLIEGAVRVIELNTNQSQILKPGEQAVVSKDIKVQRKGDVHADLAWKEGYFYFEDADIETVMRQLSRAYGITVRYETSMPEIHFEGAISTNLTLLEVLEILQKSNIHFRLEGKEVIVMP